MSILLLSCNTGNKEEKSSSDFQWQIDRFGDAKILRYQIPAWDSLNLQQKELVYYLSQAALCGRDITFDQNYKHNLVIRRTLEAVYEKYSGDRNTADWENFMIYLKRVWFSNGIHHHYSTDKFFPEVSRDVFVGMMQKSAGAEWPMVEGQDYNTFMEWVTDLIFNPEIAPKRVMQDEGSDIVAASACNYYEGVTEKEVDDFYNAIRKKEDNTPISYGLNSKLIKENGKVLEKKYVLDGMYGPAIAQIVYWLEKASTVAENDYQKQGIDKLIEYYKTGDLKTWDDYNVLWVGDNSLVDFVNGFIEVYGDPLGMKASWESVVNFKDVIATRRAITISENAQWFEDHSPIDPRFRKPQVKGVSAKVITVAQLGGDCYPTTPIGINLPNADWIRRDHGSKSVTMENITYAYDQASLGNGALEEFCYSPEEVAIIKEHGALAGNLHTDLHECLGHGSGQLLPGTSSEALKNYSSPLEEARADLFALYYMMDQKMIELGLFTTLDVAKSEYSSYIRNGLMTQLVRIVPGKTIEQAHMRSRALIAGWCYENGRAENVIEKMVRDGKTYFVINDYNKLRTLFGKLLFEMQRIKSEGDYTAGKLLVETYAVKVDPALHTEVLERYNKLNLAPYSGFINPVLEPVIVDGKITDVKVIYPDNYTEQMMNYSKKFSFLPNLN
ncbi:MAG: dihydrofolate reductase [Bacteroidales bacterium]|nr:dihydrofolate reductase [Bacteroidales bacterium]